METDTRPDSSLEPFLAEGLITDVLNIIKSGKEATVYCCEAHPRTGADLLGAEVYRPPQFRGFRNDSLYQEGRVILDRRARRAFKSKTRMGRAVQFALWSAHEFDALRLLHSVGADVPRPLSQAGAAILMEYVGDEDGVAPMLNRVSPTAPRPLASSSAS